MAAVIDEYTSLSVLAVDRPTKALAFDPCSAWSTSATSITRDISSLGLVPLSIHRKFAGTGSDGSGSTGSLPLRMRS